MSDSSLSALGYIEGGAEAVVDAPLEAVAPGGTVMVPTFNHGAADIYDWRTTPSVNGAVTKGAAGGSAGGRSTHPTHPYAAIGPDAEASSRGTSRAGPSAPARPWGKLAERAAWCCCWAWACAQHCRPHRRAPRADPLHRLGGRPALDPPGEWLRRARLERPVADGSCLIEWDPLEERMRSRGLIREGRNGDGLALLMTARDVIETTFEMTAERCPRCRRCRGRSPLI